jgi:hypothetical protein
LATVLSSFLSSIAFSTDFVFEEAVGLHSFDETGHVAARHSVGLFVLDGRNDLFGIFLELESLFGFDDGPFVVGLNVFSSSSMILSCFSCFSSNISSSFDRGSSISCLTSSSILLHSAVLWSVWPSSKRQSCEHAKAGRVQLSEKQNSVALFSVTGQIGLPYEII